MMRFAQPFSPMSDDEAGARLDDACFHADKKSSACVQAVTSFDHNLQRSTLMGRKSPTSSTVIVHGTEGHSTVCDGQMQRLGLLKHHARLDTSRQRSVKGSAKAQRNGSITNISLLLQQVNRHQQLGGDQVVSTPVCAFTCYLHVRQLATFCEGSAPA